MATKPAAKPANAVDFQLSAKVAPKGGLSIYFEGWRFPTTLNYDQWLAIFEQQDKIKKFIDDNRGKLKASSSGGGPSGSTAL